MGRDTWACQPLTTRGSREVLIGIEVDRITTDFPMVDLQEATREIQNSTDDQKIKDLRVPAQVGGHIDVLLGIQYSAHFPTITIKSPLPSKSAQLQIKFYNFPRFSVNCSLNTQK